jgi:predicted O-methyltransferase YrrM
MLYPIRKLIFKLSYLKLNFLNNLFVLFHNIFNSNLKIIKSEVLLKKIFLLSNHQINLLKDEIIEDNEMNQLFKNLNNSYYKKIIEQSHLIFLYIFLRSLKPKIILTTGVATGFQEAIILSALYRNNLGKLLSIDLPGKKNLLTFNQDIPENNIGSYIPEKYKINWKLIVGDAREEIGKIFANNSIDVFIHDSNHTVSHMIFEYSIARIFMKESAYVFSDDILIFNNAFCNFLKINNLTGYALYPKLNYGFFKNCKTEFEKKNSVDTYFK